MGRFAPQHPGKLTILVGKAVADGNKPSEVRRTLLAGRLNDWDGPYEMPLETVRYYGKKEKQRRAATLLTDRVKNDPAGAVDYLAKSLLSEAELAIKALRETGKKDPETLKKWAEVLAKLNPLVRPEPVSNGKQAPRDPLARSLAAAMRTSPSPGDTPLEGEHTGDKGSEQRSNAASTHTSTDHAHVQRGAVALPSPDQPVYTGLEGEGWGPVVPVGPAST